jgi:hypothetical protein
VPPTIVRFATTTALATLFTTTLFAAGAVKESVHLVVTGGPNAGTYDKTTDRGGCSSGLTTRGAWGNQLSDPKDNDTKHFNSLQLVVPDPKKPHDFLLKVGFGPLLHRGAEYVVDTKTNKGSGTVTVVDRGATAVVNFDAKTAQGVRLNGTIDCKSVMRAP